MTEPEPAPLRLECDRCGARFDLGPLVFGCPRCAAEGVLSVLEVSYVQNLAPALLAKKTRPRLPRYADLLPVEDSGRRISLGEGDTPLLRSRGIGPRLGLPHLYFKNETANPTWSFKDRYLAVTVNTALQLGFGRAVVSSTGNLGVSAAAYCAAAGMACVFLAPPETSRPVLDQARLHGAHVLVTTWEGRQPIFEHLTRHRGWFPIGLFLPRPVHNPFGIEGYRAIAYEIIDELGTAPGAILFPCARGNGLYGTWKGFRDAVQWGWIPAAPAMVACQPAGANSLEASLRCGAAEAVELPPVESVAVSTKETVADTRALQAIRASKGDALSATDAEILQAVEDLAREGLCVEPASALPVACLTRLLAGGMVGPSDVIVCVLTAAGIKWPEQLGRRRGPAPRIDPTPDAVDRYLTSVGL